jgi:hypothetical protein
MTWMLDRVGRHIAAYLQKPAFGYEPFTPPDPEALRAAIKPGDILLIEGRTHIAGVIKYLTQSTWSHAALYVGPIDGQTSTGGEPCSLVESNLEAGIISVPLSTYFAYHTRICRPVGLSPEDRKTVCDYAIERIGLQYDLKNIIDLGRYLVPLPVPQRWRRRMIALGSGDPTKLICSALIAQAYGVVGYPILPAIERVESAQARQEIYHIRDSSLYCPRDFDISPYFAVIKPTIEMGFNYKTIKWSAAASKAAERT